MSEQTSDSTIEARRRLAAIREVLWNDERQEWRELNSCADAVQEITGWIDCPEAGLPPYLGPVVWTVFIELDGDDVGILHGVYATEPIARAAAKAEYDDRVKRGEVPWVEEGMEPGDCNETWDFDIHVDAAPVQGATS